MKLMVSIKTIKMNQGGFYDEKKIFGRSNERGNDAFRSNYLYSGNLTLLPDIQTDLVYGVNGNTNIYGDIWRWKEIKPTNTDIEAVYGALYDVINRCNFMLDRADAVRKKTTDDKDLDKLDQCCGEAYFARALAYSELVKLFCKAYESDEDAAGQLGVILSQHYLGDETMRRASLKDSYQFILDDLDRAAELLELEEDFNTDTQGTLYDSIYFNEYTVHALRARVLLYMERWEEAIKYAISHGEVGDVIVLAGKGHEDYQEIKGVKYPMDERVLIAEVLEELKEEKQEKDQNK